MMAGVEKFHFRLVLLGSHGTGKTSILNRFLYKKFETKYKPTVEDLFSKVFDLGSIELKVDFLDTSGSMQFPAMRRLSITNGSAFLIVYAVDDETSYDVLKMCFKEIQDIRPDYQEIPIVFAGNKCDIPREKRKVLKETVSNYVHYELPRLRAKVIECSCRDGINIDNIFKAYLTLAKVSLSAAVSANDSNNNNHRNRPASNPLSTTNEGPPFGFSSPALTLNNINNRRTSSMKDALGVRKSCDASIISPLKSRFNPASSASSSTAASKNNSKTNLITRDYNNSSSKADEHDNDSNVVNLATAIRSKLSLQESQPKPRSRSLIWRPSRRSTSSRTNSDSSECRTS